MKTNNIKRVPDCFVGEDCIQYTFDYKNKMILINLDDVIYKDLKDDNEIINTYLNDERRKQFPYNNIPVFKGKKGLFGKINYVNELMDFNKKYVCIKPASIKMMLAIKENNNAYLIEDNVFSTGEVESIIISKHDLFNYYDNEVFVSLNSNIVSYGLNMRLKRKINDNKLIKLSNMLQIHNSNNNLEIYRITIKYIDNDIFEMQKELFKDNIDISLLSYISMYIKYHEKSFNYDVGEIKRPDINLKYNPNIKKEELEISKQFIKKK